jgi:hypothetical protein
MCLRQQEVIMLHPIIHCPGCHRELFNLHRPQCLWCGAQISPEQFEQVAMPQQFAAPITQQPMPIFMPQYEASQFGWGLFWRRLNPWASISGSVSPWERNLRIVGASLFVGLALFRLIYFVWEVWRMSHLMPPIMPPGHSL